MKNKVILVYYGNGEGKTSAALGHAVRAAGYGKICIIQFMKGQRSGEHRNLKKIKNIEFYISKLKDFLTDENKSEHRESARSALNLASQKINQDYFLVILDEVLYALEYALISEKELLDLLKNKNCNVVLTGRKVTKNILKISDVVTELKERKHHYHKTKKTIHGIEF